MAAPELQQGTLDLLILTTLHTGNCTAGRFPGAYSNDREKSCAWDRDPCIQRCTASRNAGSFAHPGAFRTKAVAQSSTSCRPPENARCRVSRVPGESIRAP